MYRRIGYALVSILLLAVLVLLGNYMLIHRTLAVVLDEDERNIGVEAFAYYDYFLIPNTLVLDLQNVSEKNSPADVFRVLLQFSASQKKNEYESVKLKFRGKTKFILTGQYFRKLGLEYNSQNPVYTMRTMPENLYSPDGKAAFGTWTGGLLAVLGKQMEDFTEFQRKWYIDDLAKTGG